MINMVIINAQKQDRDKIMTLLSVEEDFKVVAHGKDGYDALKLIGSLKPDIAILDNHLDFIDGEEIPLLLKARSPSTAIVILTAKISDYQLQRAAANEVAGFVYKETDMETLPRILTGISRGECFISPFLAARVLYLLAGMDRKGKDTHKVNRPKKPIVKRKESCKPANFIPGMDPTGYLSKIELRILTYIGEGRNSAEIAESLGFAVGTVRNYVSSIMRKTGLSNRSQMVRYAFAYHLVPLDKL